MVDPLMELLMRNNEMTKQKLNKKQVENAAATYYGPPWITEQKITDYYVDVNYTVYRKSNTRIIYKSRSQILLKYLN